MDDLTSRGGVPVLSRPNLNPSSDKVSAKPMAGSSPEKVIKQAMIIIARSGLPSLLIIDTAVCFDITYFLK